MLLQTHAERILALRSRFEMITKVPFPSVIDVNRLIDLLKDVHSEDGSPERTKLQDELIEKIHELHQGAPS